MAKELVTATEGFWAATKDGRGELVTAGTVYASDHAHVKGNRDKFKTQEEMAETAEPQVFAATTEQATAAPGQKRAAVSKRTAKRKANKSAAAGPEQPDGRDLRGTSERRENESPGGDGSNEGPTDGVKTEDMPTA